MQIRTADYTATYKPLRTGAFGVRIVGLVPAPGDEITATTRAGDERDETIDRVLWSGEDDDTGEPCALCSIVRGAPQRPRQAPRKRSPRRAPTAKPAPQPAPSGPRMRPATHGAPACERFSAHPGVRAAQIKALAGCLDPIAPAVCSGRGAAPSIAKRAPKGANLDWWGAA